MKKRSTADILIDGMIEHDIRYLFCLPGVQNDDFLMLYMAVIVN